MNKTKRKRAINFDLDTAKLKEFYPKRNWRNAYKDIKKFFDDNNFTHRQGSGYISDEALSDRQIAEISRKISKTFPWLADCVNRFDVTILASIYDVVGIIKDEAELQKSLSKSAPNRASQKESLSDRLARAEKKIESLNSHNNKNLHKDKNDLSL